MNRNKAQGGLNAAILLAVIGGLILTYIIFLPADEREALLENKSIDKVRGGNGNGDEDIILQEFPGRLDTVEDIDDKTLPNVQLYETTNAKEIASINSFIVRSGWFDKKGKTSQFNIANLEDTNNVILSFQTRKNEGILSIMLNDESIFEGDLDTTTPEPMHLNKAGLKEQNTLRFSVSSVGYAFWKTNEYQFDDMKIFADVTDKSKQESSSIFTLTGTELYNAQEANLRFVPYCAAAGKVGTLDISINGKNVFSAIPVCEDAYKQPLPLSLLREGQNTISLKTSKGSYSVEQIRIEFDEEDITEKVYFFEINESHVKRVKDDGAKVSLELEFVDDERLKRADINVNDKFFTLDQDEKFYSEDITDEVERGNNFVEIIPRTRLDIREIIVKLKD